MRRWVRWAVCALGLVAAVVATRTMLNRRVESAVSARRTDQGSHGPADSSLAFKRAEHLQRGVNLTGWYWPKPNYSSPQLTSHMSVTEMRRLKALGFDHVRLCIDPAPLIADIRTGELWPGGMGALDRTVRDLTSNGLNVVLDVEPEEAWKTPLTKGKAGADNFFAFWTAFATHFAETDPEHVFFEVMNEPTMDDPYRWDGIQARIIERIRTVAPEHTVIATAAPYSSLIALLGMEPVRDEDVIYTFHEYEPMRFTHQGATWAGGGLAQLHDVPYPATPDNIQAVLDQEPDESERLSLERSGWDRWDASRIAMEIAAIDQWAQKRHVPLYCGEFGVYRKYAKPAARARWISDMRTALEARHIGWAMWDYDGNFGLITEDNGRVIDRNVLHALGL